MFRFASAFLLSLVVAPAVGQTIYNLTASTPDLSTLQAAIDASPPVKTLLDSAGSYTAFGPTNTAFAALDQTYLAALLTPEWFGHLFVLLGHHVLRGEFYSTMLMDGTYETIAEEDITVASPGPTIDGYNVLDADNNATNGVAHIIDGVLIPPPLTATIMEQGRANPEFSTLVALVEAAGLDTALDGAGPLTLFAPNNDAFAALDAADTTFLTDPANVDILTQVLQYHVAPGNVYALSLALGSTNDVPTLLQGETVTVVASSDPVNTTYTANGAAIEEQGDYYASNGLIHVVDAVLIPSNVNLPSMGGAPAPTAPPAASPTPAPAPTDPDSAVRATTLVWSVAAAAVSWWTTTLF